MDPGPDCYVGLCRTSDAAAFLHSSTDLDLGRIARTTERKSGAGGQTGSLVIDAANPYFTIYGKWANPLFGDFVDAMGQNAGWTFGVVGDTCAWVDFGPSMVSCATQATYTGLPGDSGMPVFVWWSDNIIYLAGTHIGGDGPEWFSPLIAIEDDLGTLGVVPPDPPPPPSEPVIASCNIYGQSFDVTETVQVY